MKGDEGEKGAESEAPGAADWPVLLPVAGFKDCAALIEVAARLVFGRLRARLGRVRLQPFGLVGGWSGAA